MVSAQGISVSPSRLLFSGDAGQRVTQALTVSNPSSHEVSFRVFLRDFYRDSLGEKIYLPPSSSPGSDAAWVDGLPDLIDLPAGGKQEISVHLNIPADTVMSQRGVKRCMIFLSQVPAADTATGQ